MCRLLSGASLAGRSSVRNALRSALGAVGVWRHSSVQVKGRPCMLRTMSAHSPLPNEPRAAPLSSPAPDRLLVYYFYDLPLPSPFAAPIQILSTCRALAAAGVKVTALMGELRASPEDCLKYYGLAPHPNLAICPFFAPPLKPSLLPLRLWWALASSSGDAAPKVVMSRGESGLLVAETLRRAPRRAVKFVFEAHRLCFAHEAERLTGERWREGAPLPESAVRVRERERAAIEGADGVICLTEGVEAALREVFQLTQPVLLLPSGTAVKTPGVAPRERDIDVLYVGKLEVRKGVPQLIAAMQRLPGRRLYVLGGTAEQVEACRALARSYQVSDRVECVGFVEPGRVSEYLARAKVGICPLPEGTSVTSERFTSPMKLLEMMAHNVPVVASDLPSTRAIVRHGEDALLVPPNDAAALAESVGTLLDNPALRERLAHAAGVRVGQFAWEERARRLRDFLGMIAQDSAVSAGAGGLRA
jgi:glycosyltransferase involved in cell wall biosynthesis